MPGLQSGRRGRRRLLGKRRESANVGCGRRRRGAVAQRLTECDPESEQDEREREHDDAARPWAARGPAPEGVAFGHGV